MRLRGNRTRTRRGAEPERGRGATAIDQRLERFDGPALARYHPRAPHRFAGPPLAEVALHRVGGPRGHWHLVTYGLSELDRKDSDDPAVSGWGFELTFRLEGSEERPLWAVDLLANLAAYVWSSHHPFAPGHHLDLVGPIKLDDPDTALRAGLIVVDPALGVSRGPFGSVEFLQLVALTSDELELCRSWSSAGVVELLARRDPLLVASLGRSSVLEDADIAAEALRRTSAEGSSLTELRVADLTWRRRGRRGRIVVEMHPSTAVALGPALRRELVAPGARFSLFGDGGEVRLYVQDEASLLDAPGRLALGVPLDRVGALAALFDGRTGWGGLPEWAGLRWHVKS